MTVWQSRLPLGAALLCILLLAAPVDAESPPSAQPHEDFAGSAACQDCHTAEHTAWSRSHHRWAMAQASETSVLGDFDEAMAELDGRSVRFFRQEGRFFVQIDEVVEGVQVYEVTHTFGYAPLQQYLIPRPGGRLQAFGLAWDSRPAREGGQRWFDLYPERDLVPDDPLHWSGRDQTWNWMCADCHSTNLRRNWSPETESYRTTWQEINVGCEACHGPGRLHVETARAGVPSPLLDLSASGHWERSDSSALVARLLQQEGEDSSRRTQVETCAPCHARRAPLDDGYAIGAPFMDFYRPSLLAEGLYYPDGQIRDEVFVWGSFQQSKMAAAGVVCSDCHEPHSGGMRLHGNAVCTQCHDAAHFDAVSHHRHAPETEAAACVTCHMPARTYMVIDDRRDHSFRVPRPDLSEAIGTPNACTACHSDQDATWAAKAIDTWRDDDRSWRRAHFGTALAAGRRGEPGAWRDLLALLDAPEIPAIARATALSLLPAYGDWLKADDLGAVAASLNDEDPLVRLAAVEAIARLPLATSSSLLAEHLQDPVAAVRLAATAQLSRADERDLSLEQRFALTFALHDYRDSLETSAERADRQVALGNLHLTEGNRTLAAASFRRALALDPTWIPAYLALADLQSRQREESEAEALLGTGLERLPDNAELQHALGLSLIRQQRHAEAVPRLGRAAMAAPQVARFGYVHAVALWSVGRSDEAIKVLQELLIRHPADRASLEALAAFLQRSGRPREALEAARRIQELQALE